MRGQMLKRNIMILTSTLSGFLFTVLIVILIFDFNHSTFKLSKLNKYIRKEDNYLSVLKYYNLDLTSTDDTIKINISNDSETDELVGTLSNNILTFTIPKKDKNILLKGKLLYSIADSIGQLNGNDKGYVSSILGSLDYSKMSIKRNGIEIYSDKEIYTCSFQGTNFLLEKDNTEEILSTTAPIQIVKSEIVK